MLQSELRSQLHREQLNRKLAEEQEQLQKARDFHARPAPHPQPFLPAKSTKPLTQVEPLPLHSSERAEKRREFDEKLKKKEEELAELQAEQERLRKVQIYSWTFHAKSN